MRGLFWIGVVGAIACGTDGSTVAADSGGSSTGTDQPVTSTSSSTASSGSSAAEDSSSSGTEPPAGETTGSTTAPAESSSSSTGEPEASEFLAGFDVADISPNEGQLALNIYMGSYGAPFVRGPAEGVHDSIYVRSFALQLGDTGFVAAIADLPGMGNRFTQQIRERVAAQLDLPQAHVLIGTTHTHAAPDFQGLWGGGPSEYRDPVIDEIVGSMNRAWATRDFASLEVATTTAPANNRRDWGFTDDSLTVLIARDDTDAIVGTVGIFAAHPTVLGSSNLLISRDWCGGYVDTVEAHTDAPAVLFNGVLGDASTAVPPGDYPDGFASAIAYGSLIGDLAHEAIGEAEPIDTTLHVDHRSWDLPVDNALFQLAASLGLLDYDFAEGGGGQSVNTSSTYMRLGSQLQIVSFPGEPLTRTGLEIKDAMSTPHQAVLGQTGDSLGYFILSDEWMTGRNDDYEETVALHESAGDTAVSVIRAMIQVDRG